MITCPNCSRYLSWNPSEPCDCTKPGYNPYPFDDDTRDCDGCLAPLDAVPCYRCEGDRELDCEHLATLVCCNQDCPLYSLESPR